MAKLQFVLTTDIEVSLEDYPGAKTLVEAAEIQQKWVDDGSFSLYDIIGGNAPVHVKVTPVDE